MQEGYINYLINDSSKGAFMDYLENENSVLPLFTDRYLELLRHSSRTSERINYIITYSKELDILVDNEIFKEIFFTCDINDFYGTISILSKDNQKKLFMYAKEHDISTSKIYTLYTYMSKSLKEDLVNYLKDYKELYYELLKENNPKIVNKVLNEFNIDLSSKRFNIEVLLENGYNAFNMNQTNTIHIPNKYLTKELFNSLYKRYNIFRLRKIVNGLYYVSSNDIISKYLKEKEDYIINNLGDGAMVSPDSPYYEDIQIEGNLLDDCNKLVSEYIIDYHFEENYYNIMIDLEELLNFYYNGYINLDNERLSLYQRIQKIDMYSFEEKKELHNELKQYNLIEMFYDDMSRSRSIVKNAIKDAAITEEELGKYYDSELSLQYGVPVYKIENEPFFAIVKAGNGGLDENPTGHSYSLVGNNGLITYSEGNTYVYSPEELNPEQIVHVYPYDSYTLYRPFSNSKEASRRVWTLAMPDELVGLCKYSYNEILILERGTKNYDMDNQIPKLRKVAKYCIDKINEKDVIDAKYHDVGILLINSKKCKLDGFNINYRHNINPFEDYNYFDGISDSYLFDTKRMK